MPRGKPVAEQTVTLPASEFARLADEANANRDPDTVNPMQAELDAAERDNESDILSSLLEIEGASEVRWQVWRLLPAVDAGFVCELNSAELTVANIAARCGPGKYKVKGLDNRGRYAGARTVTIAKQSATFQGTPTGAAAAPGQSSGVADVLEILRAEKAQQAESLKSWAAILLPTLGPILASMLTRKESSVTEMINGLASLKQLQQPESTLGKIDEFAKMIEAVKGLIPEKESTGSTWVDLVRDGLQHVGPVLAGMANRQPALPGVLAQPPAQLPSPNPRPVSASAGTDAQPTAPETPAGDPMLQFMGWFKEILNYFIPKAAANRDPGLYADWMLDNLPDGIDYTKLRDFLGRADWWQLLTQFDSRAIPYQGWFAQLREEVLEAIKEGTAPETPPETDISRMSREQAGENE